MHTVCRLLLALCALGALSQLTDAADPCSFGGMDFSSLQGKDLNGGDGSLVYEYYLAVCGPLTSQAQCTRTTANAGACQVQVQPKGASYDTGNWVSPATWGYIDPSKKSLGVMYTMTGAAACWATGVAAPYISNVLLTCAPTAGAMKVTLGTAAANTGCIQNYTVPTPLACHSDPDGPGGDNGGGGGGKKKLSGGWIFVIILCVTIPVYVAGGCLYKNQKLGATGLEMCPNVEFWRDSPSLVKDGFVFTYTKLRGLCGGGGGGGGGNNESYETM